MNHLNGYTSDLLHLGFFVLVKNMLETPDEFTLFPGLVLYSKDPLRKSWTLIVWQDDFHFFLGQAGFCWPILRSAASFCCIFLLVKRKFGSGIILDVSKHKLHHSDW